MFGSGSNRVREVLNRTLATLNNGKGDERFVVTQGPSLFCENRVCIVIFSQRSLRLFLGFKVVEQRDDMNVRSGNIPAGRPDASGLVQMARRVCHSKPVLFEEGGGGWISQNNFPYPFTSS